jgi:hypothetical protein
MKPKGILLYLFLFIITTPINAKIRTTALKVPKEGIDRNAAAASPNNKGQGFAAPRDAPHSFALGQEKSWGLNPASPEPVGAIPVPAAFRALR